MDEFDLIARYFAPLAEGFPGAAGLRDDAALLVPPAGQGIVATTDSLHEGVHFIGNEPPGLLARKLLRVNLSDLAAKGARPWCYLLNLSLPGTCSEAWIAAFAEGLAADQRHYGLHLAGGDTSMTQGGISLSLSAFGLVPPGRILRRSAAQAGDGIYVTGTIGDAYLGLQVAQGGAGIAPDDAPALLAAYQVPNPPVALGSALAALARAGMDISDGLAQDLGHLCAASGVGAEISADAIPLSAVAQRWIECGGTQEALLGGGDDYQLLFSIAPEQEAAAAALARQHDVRWTRIGMVTPGRDMMLCDASGQRQELAVRGWRHRFR